MQTLDQEFPPTFASNERASLAIVFPAVPRQHLSVIKLWTVRGVETNPRERTRLGHVRYRAYTHARASASLSLSLSLALLLRWERIVSRFAQTRRGRRLPHSLSILFLHLRTASSAVSSVCVLDGATGSYRDSLQGKALFLT
jgi:hypothetical protein